MNDTQPTESDLQSEYYQFLNQYAHAYWQVHPYLSLTICSFGILTNMVNIHILGKKKMQSPINCILTGIAVFDIITMVDYVPYVVHFYLRTGLGNYLYIYIGTGLLCINVLLPWLCFAYMFLGLPFSQYPV